MINYLQPITYTLECADCGQQKIVRLQHASLLGFFWTLKLRSENESSPTQIPLNSLSIIFPKCIDCRCQLDVPNIINIKAFLTSVLSG